MSVSLDIMFRAIMTSSSLAVRTMRARSQGGSWGLCPPGEGSRGPCPSQRSRETWGAARRPMIQRSLVYLTKMTKT